MVGAWVQRCRGGPDEQEVLRWCRGSTEVVKVAGGGAQVHRCRAGTQPGGAEVRGGAEVMQRWHREAEVGQWWCRGGAGGRCRGAGAEVLQRWWHGADDLTRPFL